MIEQIDASLAQARKELAEAKSEQQVEAARVKYLGKSGSLSGLRKSLGNVAPADRPRVGKLVTDAIASFEALLEETRLRIERSKLEADLQREKLDVTLPGRSRRRGHRHPVSQALEDIVEIFARLGFHVADGPEIEWDLYNFEKLGFPPDHPARDMQDTFFIDPATQPPPPPGSPPAKGAQEQLLLRTHTSPVQIRAMIAQPPPVRIIAPGKVYRADSDITHTPMFHQVECLHVERGISMAHMRGTLDAFAKAFFGPEPRRARRRGLRPGGVHRLRLRRGHRPPRHAPPRHRRPALALRERRAFPGAILTTRSFDPILSAPMGASSIRRLRRLYQGGARSPLDPPTSVDQS